MSDRPEARDPAKEEGDDEGRCAYAATGLLRAAERRAVTLAIAESLTGGQVASTLVGVPDASRVLVGAVVAYATRVKAQVLGVDGAHLERTGSSERIWGWRPPGWRGRGRLEGIRRERSISPSPPPGVRLIVSCT